MHEQDSLFATEILSCTDWSTNGDLIDDVRRLGYITPTDLVADITFGRGRWWTRFTPDRFIRHDLNTLDGVDFRNLPEADGSVDVVAYDPPYINTNTDASTLDDFADRFGIRDETNSSFADLWALISGGLDEAVRILRPGGIALVKCMAYTNGRTFRNVPAMVTARLETLGVDQVDEAIFRRHPGPALDRDRALPHPPERLDAHHRPQTHPHAPHRPDRLHHHHEEHTMTDLSIFDGFRLETLDGTPALYCPFDPAHVELVDNMTIAELLARIVQHRAEHHPAPDPGEIRTQLETAIAIRRLAGQRTETLAIIDEEHVIPVEKLDVIAPIEGLEQTIIIGRAAPHRRRPC